MNNMNNKHLLNIVKEYTECKYVYILHHMSYESKESKNNEILGVFKANSLKEINNDALYKILYKCVIKNCTYYKLDNYKIIRIELYEDDGGISVFIEKDDNKYVDKFILEKHEML